MENLNYQLMAGLYRLLTTKPVDFIIQHSLTIGLITGIIAVVPFLIKRLPHAVMMVLSSLMVFYICNAFDLSMAQVLYSPKSYLVVQMLGNYIIGCIFGFALANIIQRIRGEHDHVTNN